MRFDPSGISIMRRVRFVVGEIERQSRAVGLRLAGGVIVDLEHEVGAAVEQFRDALRRLERERRPASIRPGRAPAGIRACRSRDSPSRCRAFEPCR